MLAATRMSPRAKCRTFHLHFGGQLVVVGERAEIIMLIISLILSTQLSVCSTITRRVSSCLSNKLRARIGSHLIDSRERSYVQLASASQLAQCTRSERASDMRIARAAHAIKATNSISSDRLPFLDAPQQKQTRSSKLLLNQ